MRNCDFHLLFENTINNINAISEFLTRSIGEYFLGICPLSLALNQQVGREWMEAFLTKLSSEKKIKFCKILTYDHIRMQNKDQGEDSINANPVQFSFDLGM